VAFSPDSKLVASASNDHIVKVWDLSMGVALQAIEGHSDYINDVAFSLNGKLLASASKDRTVKLWDAVTGVALKTLEVDVVITRLSFSKEGPYLETNRGLLSIQPLYAGTFPLPARSLCEVFVKERWVARGMENLLCL
jgi:WD40 repeat protein